MSKSSRPPGQRPSSAPPEAWGPLHRLAELAKRPIGRFLRIEAASGLLLLAAAAVALVWANSPWGDGYERLWQTPLGIRIGDFTFERTFAWFVNDVLMAVFFFVVGMEIRREAYDGALSSLRRAVLPAAAALGGMLAPAALYLLLAGQGETRSGWGVPMATDIAFAVGILTLLGKRAPPALRILLLALAVIDDLGAIVVIALFYSSGVALSGLLVAALALAAIFALQRAGIRSKIAYAVPALVTWGGIYAAGVHPTIAGVLLGVVTPVRAWLGREARSPAEGLIETLHPWVAFGIMPLFALANAGVTLGGASLDAGSQRVALGVAVGLIIGKPVGVLSAIGLTVKLRIAELARELSGRHLIVLGIVAGIGFTMALFIAQLAFPDARLLAAAKLGVLAASALCAVVALVVGRMLLAPAPVAEPSKVEGDAEDATTP